MKNYRLEIVFYRKKVYNNDNVVFCIRFRIPTGAESDVWERTNEMKTTKTRFLSVILSLCMIVSCMAGISFTAGADTAYGDYLVVGSDTEDTLPDKVVRFNGCNW